MFVAEGHKAYLRQPYYTLNSPFRLSGTEAKHKQGVEALLDDDACLSRRVPHNGPGLCEV